jgi:GrpB-like predicted nucleotidyltransferase (UPF0157 family)
VTPERPTLGLESKTVRLVPYDDRWPAEFVAEQGRIRQALGTLALQLEHIGSTAVPGLPAKPILDILAGYHERAALPDLIAAIQRAGYIHRGESGIPGREFFRRGDPRAYHIHLTEIGNRLWNDHLAFRDRLRADPPVRDAYAALKARLAEQFPTNREAYIEGKAAFIQALL